MTDKPLTEHFSLYQATRTDHEEFAEENRDVTIEQISKLTVLMVKVEEVWQILGGCVITSAYRCPDLNEAVGSTDRSQHLLCEAADLVPVGDTTPLGVRSAFNKLVFEATKGNLRFGQLGFESQSGRDGNSICWVHISLGDPYRAIERCGQIFIMTNGVYKQVGKI